MAPKQPKGKAKNKAQAKAKAKRLQPKWWRLKRTAE